MKKTPSQLQFDKLKDRLNDMPEYILKYANHKKIGYSIKNTLGNYLYDYQVFLDWLLSEGYYEGERKDIPLSVLEKLKSEDIKFFTEYMLLNEQTDKTVNRRMAALKDLFHYLSQILEDEQGYPVLRRNVMAKVQLLKIDESESYRAEQIQDKILHVTQQHNEIQEFLDFIEHQYIRLYPDDKRRINYHAKNVDRDLAIIALFLDSGLRLFELAALELPDIQFEKYMLYVRKGKGNKKDTALFGTMAASYVKRYLAIRRDRYGVADDYPPLFVSSGTGRYAEPRSIDTTTIQKMVKKYAVAFNRPHLTPHKLRHTFATQFYKVNKDPVMLKRQLRHSSIETTMIYTHIGDSALKDAVIRTNDFTPSEDFKANE